MSRVYEAICERALSKSDTLVLSGTETDFTYSELRDEIDAWVKVLRDCRIKTVAVLADNSPEWVCLDVATQIAEVVLVPLPKFFSAEQLRHALLDSSADALITDQSGLSDHLLIHSTTVKLPSSALQYWRCHPQDRTVARPIDTAKVSYTSGTTGQPKGVCLSLAAMESVALSLVEATRDVVLHKHLCLLPLATLLENIAGVYSPLLAGCQVSLPSLDQVGWTGAAGLDSRRLCGVVQSEAPNSIILVPELLRVLLGAAHSGWQPPESLQFVAVGGARVPADLLQRAQSAGLPVFEGYGMTECASVVALNTPGSSRIGSVGRPLGHVRVRVDNSGQVLVASDIAPAYIGSQNHATHEYATGDIGYLDDDGFLYIRGRKRNVFINSYGRNISPDWIEPEFLRGRSIFQIVVFGESRPWNTAVVVTNPFSSSADVQADIDTVNAMLPDYSRVTRWIAAREPFSPQNGQLTVNGRVKREAVWKHYQQQINACYDACLSCSA